MTIDGLTSAKAVATADLSRRSEVTVAKPGIGVRCVTETSSVSGGTVLRSQVPTRPDAPVTRTTGRDMARTIRQDFRAPSQLRRQATALLPAIGATFAAGRSSET